MLSRIGRFFRRLGGERNRPPTTEQDPSGSHASRQQDESDLLARDVIGRTRSIAVSDRSIHQARSVAVTDTRPMVAPAWPQERRDIPTEALPFASPRETLPPVGSIPRDPEGSGVTTFEGDSTGDSEWDALWHLRGTVQGASQPATPPPLPSPTSRPSAGSDRPASPPISSQGSVQRAPEPGPVGEGISGAEPEPFVQDEPRPERGRTAAVPTARQSVPRSAAPIAPMEEVQRRPSPGIMRETPSEGEPGSIQRQVLETELPEMAPGRDAGPGHETPAAPPASVQRPGPSAERAVSQPASTPVQRDLDEPRPSLPTHPAGEGELLAEPEAMGTPPESTAVPQRQGAPEASTPVQPAIQRQASVQAQEPDTLPPEIALQPEAVPGVQSTTVQPTPVEPESVPPLRPAVQKQPSLETPASEPSMGIGVEAVLPEDALPQPGAMPSARSVPRAQAPKEPESKARPMRASAQEPAMPESVPQPEPQTPAQSPSSVSGIQREIERAAIPAPVPELASLPSAAVIPPAPTRARPMQRTEATEPTIAQPVQRELSPTEPPAPGLPEAANAVSEATEASQTEPDLAQQHVDRREALRQALQPRIVPTVVQRAVEERATEQTSSAATETGSQTEEGQGPNIEALAKDVYRILKKRLLVERERDLGRT